MHDFSLDMTLCPDDRIGATASPRPARAPKSIKRAPLRTGKPSSSRGESNRTSMLLSLSNAARTMVRGARRSPGRTLGVVFFSGLLVLILVNALFLQKDRVKRPLFASLRFETPVQSAAEPVKPPALATSNVLSPIADSALPVAVNAADDHAAAINVVSAIPPKRPTNVTPDIRRANVVTKPAATDSRATQSILSAQKALVKLGYDVKPDGVSGASTRAAIERFERDSGLPAHGELTAKIQRVLMARAGVAAH